MVFAAPIWLLGLLPWAAVVVYLLPGRGTPALVSYLGLWKQTAAASRRTARRWPGAALLFALLALLMAILAAAQPARFARDEIGGEVSIVLDRGATMSLPSVSGKVFRNVIARVGSIGSDTRVTLVPVPGQAVVTTGDAWAEIAAAMPPTAIAVQLDQAVADQLRQTRRPVFVLSDQRLHLNDKRIVQIQPEAAAGMVAIKAIGARLLPQPQVMVRLENHSSFASVQMTIQSGDAAVHREVSLPANGQSADRFFDLPSLGETVVARIDVENNPWSQAFLVRQSNGIHLAVDSSVDDSVRRIAEIYGKDRPALAGAQEVLVSDHLLANDQSGIWIAGSTSAAGRAGAAALVPHAITRNVTAWPPAGAAVLPAGFVPVVSVGSTVAFAVRDGVARQVWVNADLREWEKTSDFVVFFANAFDWIAGKNESYAYAAPAFLGEGYHAVGGSNTPRRAKPGEWPGLYQSAAGRQIAVDAGDFPKLLPVEPQPTTDANPEMLRQKTSIAGAAILAALGCLLASAWMSSNSRKP